MSRRTWKQQRHARPFTTTNILNNFENDDNASYSFSLSVPTMQTMEEIGALISVVSKPADVILLDGDLGAGKTTFSRGFVHCKLGLFDDEYDESDDELHDEDSNKSKQQKNNNENTIRVTSPTYLLSNTYVYKDDDDDQRIQE
jgi:hypothetical protein